MPDCICIPAVNANGVGYNQLIGNLFGECLYDEFSIEWMPFVLGMTSTLIWIFALAPQIVENWRNKTTEALSPVFMTVWLAGDLFTFAGSLIGGQRVTMTACALYFCANDACMLFQRWYYSKRRMAASNTKKAAIALSSFALISGSVAAFSLSSASSASARSLLGEPELCNADVYGIRFILGSIISWIAGSLYFFSRIPQIQHMFKRKTVQGLDIRMFILCILANICGGLQFIFEAGLSKEFDAARWCAKTLPFVIGSIGTLVFDFVIISMFIAFRWNKVTAKDVERQ